MEISIIIVNYQTSDLIIKGLDALIQEIKSLNDCFRVCVIDNDSQDGSFEKLINAVEKNEWSKYVRIIATDRNGGFAYGNNIGLKELAIKGFPDIIWLLNPDTCIRPGAAMEMLNFMRHNPKAAICGSRLEKHDGTPQISAFNFPTILSEFLSRLGLGVASRKFGNYLVPRPVQDTPHSTDWLAGASVMIKREVFDKIGLLDEHYFLYFEEVDFFYQAKRHGYQCWYIPASRVVHEAGAATGIRKKGLRQPSYWFESRRRFFLKNKGAFYTMLADAAWIIGCTLWSIKNKLGQKKEMRPPHLLIDFIHHSVFLEGFNYKE